ncbi:MAG: Flagellar hook capping protein [Nitrosospira multiformis]|jgi:flagellar basal-body rod modification protein FlgD|nr:Flagellar hook capping protein [Nitrosospira multiformis]
MSTIQNTQSTSNPFAAYGTRSAAKPAEQDLQDRFLKLLVTQMKNQDPLNPLDNAQVTTQLAQISTVNGVERLNATIRTIADSFTAGQSLQAAGMIGREVLVPGSALQLASGAARFGIELTQPADEVKVRIHDAAGREIQVMNLGPQAAGSLELTWDGKTSDGSQAADGNYSISVAALRGDQKVEVQALAAGIVQGVSQGNQGVQLDVGSLGMVGLADIRQIF